MPDSPATILARLQEAKAQDRTIDEDITVYFGIHPKPVAHLTGSIDDARGMISRMLPGWGIVFSQAPRALECQCILTAPFQTDRVRRASAKAPADQMALAAMTAMMEVIVRSQARRAA